MSIKNKLTAIDILKEYKDKNPYILMLRRNVLLNNEDLYDFNVEYILKNHNFQPMAINRTIKLADWYQIKKKEDWNLEFLPEKIK
jgi:hypothetical protein